jgi:hypothetical protein
MDHPLLSMEATLAEAKAKAVVGSKESLQISQHAQHLYK